MPEGVSVTHREEAEDDCNASDNRPEGAGESCQLTERDEEGNKSAEYKTATETKTLLEGVWFREVVH